MRRESEEAKKKLEELEQELVQNYDEQRKRAEEEYESELKEEHTAEEIQRINQVLFCVVFPFPLLVVCQFCVKKRRLIP